METSIKQLRAEACADQVDEPMLQLVFQGTRNLSIGDQILHFVPATYFTVPLDLPAPGQVCGEIERKILFRARQVRHAAGARCVALQNAAVAPKN